MKAIAVIGSQFGDEGKGVCTDYHSDPNTVVVRFNGGAQAGHTVVRDGMRHVFHHFGSGTLRGAKTFLSEFFISNPIIFSDELAELSSLGTNPAVLVDPNGLVTTVWDMIINQMVEESRGSDRHGSCGVGINETIKRSEHEEYRIVVGDLRYEKHLTDVFTHRILKKWIPYRLHELGLNTIPDWANKFLNADTVQKFMEYCCAYRDRIQMTKMARFSKIVFEGAQGLLLDEDHRFFPHVTHSHTGLTNVIKLASQIDLTDLDVVYATRAYVTRHGMGPFPREVSGLSYSDPTNVPNKWQGTIRFGELDLDVLAESILNDSAKAPFPISRTLAVTCLDQIGPEISFWENDIRQKAPWEVVIEKISKQTGIYNRLGGFGPESVHMKPIRGN